MSSGLFGEQCYLIGGKCPPFSVEQPFDKIYSKFEQALSLKDERGLFLLRHRST